MIKGEVQRKKGVLAGGEGSNPEQQVLWGTIDMKGNYGGRAWRDSVGLKDFKKE